VRVLVVDSGAETSHSALQSGSIKCWQVVSGMQNTFRIVPEDGVDVFGHGTAVVWIIRHYAPGATVESLRVLGGDLRSSSQRVLAGLNWGMDQGFDIINCSFGTANPKVLDGYKGVVDRAFMKNVLLVSACNNFDHQQVELPGWFPSVVSTDFGKLNDLELRRRMGAMVEFVARGERIRLPWKDGDYRETTGSSFAAPHLAALAARIRELKPQWNVCQIKSALYEIAPEWTGVQDRTMPEEG
jgi:subtilisin family serine protease